jgi:HemY protein
VIARALTRSVFWLVLILVLGVGLALLASVRFGNVAVFLPPYRVDLSLNLAVVIILVVFVLVHLTLRLLAWTFTMPGRVREYRETRRALRAENVLRTSVAAWMEGRYARAERAARDKVLEGEAAALVRLTAARSAHAMHEFERRDRWLSEARAAVAGITDGARRSALTNAALITECELLLEQQRGEEALRLVEQLLANGARHMRSVQLALRAHQQCGNWTEVLRTARLLEKRNALHPVAAAKIRAEAYAKLFAQYRDDADGLRTAWHNTAAADRLHPAVAAAAVRAFNAAGLCSQAARILEAALAKEWNAELVRLYGDCAVEPPTPLIEVAEGWLKDHPGDPVLLSTLGRLCVRAHLWGKAQRFLQDSLGERPARDTHLELARLFDAIGRSQEAQRHYQAAAVGQ